MKKILFALFGTLLLNSCTIYGLTNDYSKLTDDEKSLIHTKTDFLNLKSKNIYVINGTELKTELKKNEKSLVYIFTNGCTSKSCMPMSTYESFAKENNYKLYLVMSGYGHLYSTTQQRFDSPLFTIDYGYYDTKYRSTAWDRLENDLRNKPKKFKTKSFEGSLFFFERDKLVKVLNELPTL
jgi:hypothetical protein